MKFFERNPIIMLMIGIMGVSVSAILVRLADAPSAVIATLRLSWTVLLLTPMVFFKRDNRAELMKTEGKKLRLCIISGICLAFHFLSWFESLKHTSVASSLAFGCTEVIWVSIGFFLFLKGMMTKKETLCIIVTVAGSLLIAFADSGVSGRHLYGDMLALFSAVLVSVYTLIGREARKTMTTTIYTYIVYITCTVVLIGVTVLQGYSLKEFDTRAVVTCFCLAVFSTLLGHSVFSWCLKYFSPSFVAASKLCEPVIASVIAVFLFGEIPVPMQLAGGIIVLIGVFFYSKVEGEKAIP